MYTPQASKLVVEAITVRFNFQDQIVFGETLSSPVVTVGLSSGDDGAPADILSGAATVSGTIVSQRIIDGLGGVIYLLICTVTGSSGTVYRQTVRLAVLSDFGGYSPATTLTLTGDLPDGIVGAPYSSNLLIAGGFPPYFPDGIFSGADPAWMGYTVVGTNLVCAGTPDELAGTSYTFAPQVEDSALNEAFSNQTINITRITITGDLVGGFVGQPVSYQYGVSLGTAPYTFSTSAPGLPTGLAIDATGAVTGTFTAGGTFNWTVTANDANAVVDTHPDDCVVIGDAVWMVSIGGVPAECFTAPWEGDTWTQGSDFSGATRLYYDSGVVHNLNPGSVSYAYTKDKGATWLGLGGLGYSSDGGHPAFANGYMFVSGGSSENMFRREIPDGAWTIPAADVLSRGNSLHVAGGRLVNAFTGRAEASYSNDDGDSWNLASGAINAAGTYNQPIIIGGSSSVIVAAYNNVDTDQVHIKISTDLGDTWSGSPVYTFPGVDVAKTIRSVIHDGVNFMVLTSTGQLAYSATGSTWTLSANTLTNALQAYPGVDRTMVCTSDGVLYSSDDNGVTWQTRTDPAGASTIGGVAWIYP